MNTFKIHFQYFPVLKMLNILLLIVLPFQLALAGPKYKTTKSGLKYTIVKKVKKGTTPLPYHTVQILFKSTLQDGTPVAEAADRNNPMEFIYGNNDVLKGWEEAVSLLKIGEKGIFILPPSLAYGDKKAGKIPPNSTIIIEIELLNSFPTFFSSPNTSYKSTESGLKYLIHNKKRSNDTIVPGNFVIIHYTGYTIGENGKRTEFDASRKKKAGSLVQCGVKKFIPGLDEGILLSQQGDSITLIIPPNLGYGQKTNQLIPPNSTIGFDIFIEKQISPFFDVKPEMINKKGFSYGFIEKKSEKNAQLNDIVKLNLTGYYLSPNSVPYIFESSFEKQQLQTLRLDRALENPAWYYVLQQCGKGDRVKMVIDPEMARSELKKLIPENVSVFFEFEVIEVLPPSFLNTDSITAMDIGNGLSISMVKEGIGEALDSLDIAYIHYTGYTLDSLGNRKVFDSSFDRGKPFEVKLGTGSVIKGWELGLLGRKESDQFSIKIPSELGYGKRGVPPLILQDETLYFDMYIIKITKAVQPQSKND